MFIHPGERNDNELDNWSCHWECQIREDIWMFLPLSFAEANPCPPWKAMRSPSSDHTESWPPWSSLWSSCDCPGPSMWALMFIVPLSLLAWSGSCLSFPRLVVSLLHGRIWSQHTAHSWALDWLLLVPYSVGLSLIFSRPIILVALTWFKIYVCFYLLLTLKTVIVIMNVFA